MYKLHLTHDDRRAIDWVCFTSRQLTSLSIGHRYFHGDDLFRLLTDCVDDQDEPDAFGDSWDDPIDWVLNISEHIAWQIKEGLESEDSFCSCFSEDLKGKLRKFCDDIV